MVQVKNSQVVKQSNRTLVLDFIRQNEPVSRRTISRDLDISPTTSSAAVTDLIEIGFVREIGHGVSTGGRRPVMLEINPKGGTIISVDVASTFNQRVIRAAALNLKGTIITEVKENHFIDSNETMLASIRSVIHSLIIAPDVKLRDAVAIGISAPGLVNAETGELVYASLNVDRLPLGPTLHEEFQVPILIQNAEDAAALGEYYFGQNQAGGSVVYLTMGTGVGMGFVIDGDIYQRNRTSSGELGHITVKPDGPECICGNHGCLTTLVSSPKIVSEIKDAIAEGYTPAENALCGDDLDVNQIILAAEAGDLLCEKMINEVAQWAAIAVANVVNLLNPEKIVFGGELFEKNNYFFSLVKEIVEQRTLKHFAETVQLTQSKLGRQAGLQGVAVLALDALLKSPLA
ncbi:MAG: ROK family protein [Anaerolineae bacterium]